MGRNEFRSPALKKKPPGCRQSLLGVLWWLVICAIILLCLGHRYGCHWPHW